ncbi:carbohydrate ABC transporter permease [Dactylosporangium sp. CA-152071]|uniref:carbohydrate ABC transporter permease n=1 Tax=Dactylosporangium sp. CA-152071 TaxID=3239933 RepID=UPI003D8E1A08
MSTPTTRVSRWERLSRAQRENLNGQLLTGPSLVLITLVILIPFVLSVVFSFSDIRLIDIPRLSPSSVEWTLDNYRDAMGSDAFWGALWTTIAYSALTTIGAVGVGLALAFALRRPFRGRGLVRVLLLIPYVLPVIASAMIWRTMLNPQYGIVNAFGQEYLGWDSPIGFLSTTSMDLAGLPVPVSLLVVVCFEVWKSFPLAFLFVTARLQSVPGAIEEAGALDGASGWQSLRHIVLPQLRGVVLLLVLLRFIWSFQSFNDIYLLTGGAGGTQVMAIKVYTQLINRADIGGAAAYGMLMSVILCVLLAGYVLLSRRKETM